MIDRMKHNSMLRKLMLVEFLLSKNQVLQSYRMVGYFRGGKFL